MTIGWWICLLAFLAAYRVFGRAKPSGRDRDFALAYLGFATIGLLVVARGFASPLHAIWYLPLAVLSSSLFANRDLFVLKHRLDALQYYDVDDLKRKVEHEVKRFNSELPEEKRIK